MINQDYTDIAKLFTENLPIILQINELRGKIDALRPLPKEVEGRIMQKLRLDWNYHSNAIEGNSLTYGETFSLLLYGLTAKGKSIKDHLDIKGHNEAIELLLAMVKEERDFTEVDIRNLHKIILVEPYEVPVESPSGLLTSKTINLGVYKTSPNSVRTVTGEMHYYAMPEETPAKMQELMSWFGEVTKSKEIHPLVIAALFHYRFVAIHPFDDGNGRMSRILMNLILMKYQFPPVVIKQHKESKNQYFNALGQADVGDFEPFVLFIGENLVHSLELYLKGARGESIDEPSDFEKELSLFKKELEGRKDKVEVKRSLETQKELYEKSLKPFIDYLEKNTLSQIKDLFLDFEINGIDIVSDSDDKPNVYIYRYEYFWSFKGYDDSGHPEFIYYNEDSDIDFEPFDNWLEYKFSLYKFLKSIPVFILNFRFSTFKVSENPFDIELKIIFHLDKLNYSIFYYASESWELNQLNLLAYQINYKETLIKNMLYHQAFTENEIKNYSNVIGQYLLAYVKKTYENPETQFLSIKENILKEEWKKFLSSQPDGDSYLDSFKPDKFDKKFLFFSKENLNADKIENLEKNLAKKFIHYIVQNLGIKRNIGFKML